LERGDEMTKKTETNKELLASESILNQIKESLEGLRYGTVQIVVHNGQIVQIERTEKLRFDK
jgi:hypothetical protein